jgi:NhaA family Na+:H+ antiporter
MSENSSSSRAIIASFVLLAATALALVVANSGAAGIYKAVLATEIGFDIGWFDLSDSIKNWVKNALMAVFFLFVGLEIKAEFREGALADRRLAITPFAGAAGGMAVPALIYLAVTAGTPGLGRGWAIPSATDIAFAIGVVGLLGSRISAPLRAFLLAVAVIDDLGAILVIAVFYTGALQLWAIAGMAIAVAVLAFLNRSGEGRLTPFMLVGLALWVLTLQSGINATLAGVVTALFVPLRMADGRSPLHRLEQALWSPVNFGIMPVFAFANAGVPLLGLAVADLLQPLTLGIVLGLALGKPVGITLAVFAVVRTGLARLPEGAAWRELAGIACLAGIGFTMSLFIGALAFQDEALLDQVRLGVLGGSLVATLIGVLAILAFSRQRREAYAER